MLQFTAVTPGSAEQSESTQSRLVASLGKRMKDGSIPLVVGGIVLVRALRSNGKTASQLLAGATLVGIGLRQRRHHRVTRADMVEDDHHTGTGTSEMRAESHEPGSNPREIEDDPSTESDTESIQFTDEQIEDAGEDPSADDPRIDDETTEVDLSEASMADEPAEAAGPTSEQSQPTQTDAIEPEETPEEGSLPKNAGVSDSEDEESITEEDENKVDDGGESTT